jgi:hypothetical protein
MRKLYAQTKYMNYQEAHKQIEDNSKYLSKGITGENPAHQILGTFVSSENRDNTIENRIYDECVVGHKDNAELLAELNMLGNDLIPFIAVLMKGNTIAQPLASYLVIPSNNEANISGE